MSYPKTFRPGHARACGFYLIHRKGRQQPNAKLTEEVVLELRRRRKAGATLKALASEYGVDPGTVGQVVRGKRWVHVVEAGQ